MTTKKIFIGEEAEGPDKGKMTLFIPRNAPMPDISALIRLIEDSDIHRFYFGAGDSLGVSSKDIGFMYFILDHYPMSDILCEIDQKHIPDLYNLDACKKLIKKVQFIFVTILPTDLPVFSHFKTIQFHSQSIAWYKLPTPVLNALYDPIYDQDKSI